ncbi:MAG: hypothetical protein M3N13_08505, partial [Candidatus Eremiobacteraeota bacterium]|nr:hypothetical protein [Candidatus Eremiobacteraeota bacterium]
MANEDNERELADILVNPHHSVDGSTRNVPSQHVVDNDGRLRSTITNDNGEIAILGEPSNLLPENVRAAYN